MAHPSEALLESNLIKQLNGLGYDSVRLQDGNSFISNLKAQLEKFNNTTFTNKEFDAILNHLSKGNVFEKAKILRDRFQLTKENGESLYIRFFNNEDWTQNIYQVTNQVQQQGSFLNRYDVTLLVNGLPLVQIELKRSGTEIKEAFNQINRYQLHSFWSNYGSMYMAQRYLC
jgi:type I restriction enzyme, R subunit